MTSGGSQPLDPKPILNLPSTKLVCLFGKTLAATSITATCEAGCGFYRYTSLSSFFSLIEKGSRRATESEAATKGSEGVRLDPFSIKEKKEESEV